MEDEKSLAARAANGDHPALVSIIERYRRYIYAIAWKITLHEEDALDVVQEVFERVARRIGDWDGRGALRAWLGTLTARVALDFQKRGGRERAMEPAELVALADARGHFQSGSDARETLERAQRREQIAVAMAGLSPQQRAIFSLRFLEEMRCTEIAERLGLAPAQVRSQLSRGVARLKQVLNESEKASEQESGK